MTKPNKTRNNIWIYEEEYKEENVIQTDFSFKLYGYLSLKFE